MVVTELLRVVTEWLGLQVNIQMSHLTRNILDSLEILLLV